MPSRKRIAVVTGKQFVAAVARKSDRDLARVILEMAWVGICDESPNGSSYISASRGTVERVVV